MSNWVQEGRIQKGLTYAEFVAEWRESLRTTLAGLGKDERKRIYYTRYNLERHDRVRASYSPSRRLLDGARAISEPQLWMLLTEDWCGDSGYAMPVIAAAADAAGAELRILRRDENDDIMSDYLTDGARSIPLLVAFTMAGEELFRWGSRPAELTRLRELWAEEGKTKGELIAAGIEWYEAGNWMAIDTEIAALIEAHAGVSIS